MNKKIQSPLDQNVREKAVGKGSFIVQAPAGSGKTSLLIKQTHTHEHITLKTREKPRNPSKPFLNIKKTTSTVPKKYPINFVMKIKQNKTKKDSKAHRAPLKPPQTFQITTSTAQQKMLMKKTKEILTAQQYKPQ